jgi:hypothetical protein
VKRCIIDEMRLVGILRGVVEIRVMFYLHVLLCIQGKDNDRILATVNSNSKEGPTEVVQGISIPQIRPSCRLFVLDAVNAKAVREGFRAVLHVKNAVDYCLVL